mgnify:FL=1|jgi:hypothetical protein
MLNSLKYTVMKSILLKTCFLLPMLAIGAYCFFIIYGCLAYAFGAGDVFYCNYYVMSGFVILILLGGLIVAYLARQNYKSCNE